MEHSYNFTLPTFLMDRLERLAKARSTTVDALVVEMLLDGVRTPTNRRHLEPDRSIEVTYRPERGDE